MTVNKAILIGRLGKDPDTRYMTNGEAVTNVSLATTDSYKDKEGTKQERSEWHSLVFYGRLAEVAGEYLKKGSQIYVEGQIQTRKWQDKEGKDRYTTEIKVKEMNMLGSKSSGSSSNDEHSDNGSGHAAPVRQASPASRPAAAPAARPGRGAIDQDDIPFFPIGKKGADVDWRCM